MSKFWLIITAIQYFLVSIVLAVKIDATAQIGLLIFYALNFWGCRIVELKEQKNGKNQYN